MISCHKECLEFNFGFNIGLAIIDLDIISKYKALEERARDGALRNTDFRERCSFLPASL